MTTTLSESKANYLEQVASGLADLPQDDREEVMHDLRAHLAELDEDEFERALGSPNDFVAEFRSSAGLDNPTRLRWRWNLTLQSRLEDWSRRLADLSQWQRWRPAWIWSRGWLSVSTVAVVSGGTAFRHFPIPTVGESTARGLLLVAIATVGSVWLDRSATRIRKPLSFVYNAVVVWLLAASLVSPQAVGRIYPHEEAYFPDQLIGAEGEPITNLYAYDLDGNPVEVLLFDQHGRPLRSLPSWVYFEADENPGFTEPLEYGEGAVEFARDDFGRIIPNLYPLDLYEYGSYGLEAVPPPSLGFPERTEAQFDPTDGTIPTTTTPGALD